MREREFFHLEGRTWFVRVRPSVRKDEATTHLTLELVADHETRVVSCRREEWDTSEPDFAALRFAIRGGRGLPPDRTPPGSTGIGSGPPPTRPRAPRRS